MGIGFGFYAIDKDNLPLILTKRGSMRGIGIISIFLTLCSGKGGKMEKIELPDPLETRKSIEECLLKRRSIRSFSKKELTLEEISTLLWSSQGITEKRMGFRTAPSAGALYPLEVYLIKRDGLFHYIPKGHKIERLGDKDLRDELCKAALSQEYVREAPCVFVITGVPKRITGKYGERGVRYMWIEVGHAAQNLLLEAVALGLGGVPIGAFFDDEVAKILRLSKGEVPLYIIPIGHPRQTP